LWLGNYAEADRRFLGCLNYHRMPEPYLGLTLSSLRKGSADNALRWISELITRGFEADRMVEPDPVEWTYFVISLLCCGRLAEASRRAAQFPALRHQELDRCRWILACLNDSGTPGSLGGGAVPRPSIHQLPEHDLETWINELCRMLKACGQAELCDRLQSRLRGGQVRISSAGSDGNPPSPSPIVAVSERVLPLVPGSLRSRIGRRIPKRVRSLVAKLRAGIERKDDAFVSVVGRWAREGEGSRALLLGASDRSAHTRAFLEGIQKNPSMPTVLCSESIPNASRELQKRFGEHPQIRFGLPGSRTEGSASEHFDLILIDRSPSEEALALETITGAETVLVREIDTGWGHAVANALLSGGQYVVADDSLSEGNRSIVFTRAPRDARDLRLSKGEP
jgi:hypothetical protein